MAFPIVLNNIYFTLYGSLFTKLFTNLFFSRILMFLTSAFNFYISITSSQSSSMLNYSFLRAKVPMSILFESKKSLNRKS